MHKILNKTEINRKKVWKEKTNLSSESNSKSQFEENEDYEEGEENKILIL